MTDQLSHDPMVYFTRENGKLGLCLSYAGKWLAGIIATLISAGALAVLSLVWQSAMNSEAALLEIRLLNERVASIEKATDDRLKRYEDRLRDVEKAL